MPAIPPPIFVLAHSLKATRHRLGMPLEDLPAFIRSHGFNGLEVSDRQIGRLPSQARHRFQEACREQDCGLIFDINVDFTAAAPHTLQEEIDHARGMIETAAGLGARAVRLCIGGQALSVQKLFRRQRNPITTTDQTSASSATLALEKLVMWLGHQFRKSRSAHIGGLEAKLGRAIGALRQILPTAEMMNLSMGIENHWGLSGDPEIIVHMIETVGSPRLGACPDLGNFPRGIDPPGGLKQLAPHTVILHAKSYRFARNGEEKTIDYRTCLSVFRTAGFSGPITVEYEGFGDDLAGCLKTRDLVLRHW